jgi:iron-sulfur cluster assembly protein
MPVTVTERAAREIHAIIRQQELDADKIRLRVGVRGGGCSGFSYILDLTEAQRDTDEVWEQSFAPASASARAAADQQGGVAVAEGDDNASKGAADDEAITVRVICDPKSYLYLNGTVIDFKDEGMMARGFVFNNPNASTSCGCGSSFSA